MHPSSSSSRSIPPQGSAGAGRGMDGAHSGVRVLGGFPGARGWGQGFVAEPQGASPWSRGCVPNPARVGMGAGGESLDVGSLGSICTRSNSQCARNLEAGEVSHKGSQGRKKEYPTKTPDEKEVPGFGSGVRGCRQPPELPAWVGLHGERGVSCCPSSRSLQAPCPLPQPPFTPRPGSHGDQGPRAEWDRMQRQSVRVVVSLKPCSYGAAPHRDQRLSHATVIPGVAVTGNKQGQNTDTKLPGPPADPILGCSLWDRCPSAWKGTDPRFP